MRALARRSLLPGAALLALSKAGPATAQAPFAADWVAFQRRFVAPEGRIVDSGNRNISHSEGQGYGLLGALRANDQMSFDLILNWTLANLRRSTDALFAWRWDPSSSPNVTDLNNASDGDIFIAWAPNKNLSVTLAYVDLGRIVPGITGGRKQTGVYLSAQLAF